MKRLRCVHAHLKRSLGNRLDDRIFSDPTWQETCGVQFVKPDGSAAGRIIADPECFHFAAPLAGPFYDFPAVGITPIITDRFGRHKGVHVVVQDDDGKLKTAGPLWITAPLSKVKGLADDLGIKWYHTDFSHSEFVYTEMPSFDDCVKYERGDSKDSRL